MKIIEQINAKIKEQYPNCDAINGIAKQMLNGSDGVKMMVFSNDSEPYIFVPDDNYQLQVCHVRRGGRNAQDSPFNNVVHEMELIVVSKFVKFYHLLDILYKVGVQYISDDANTRNILRNDLNCNDDYPEVEAFKIRYNFTSNIQELIDFEKIICK